MLIIPYMFTIDEVLQHVGNPSVVFRSHTVKMLSQRYRLFKRDGTTCVACNKIGTHFKLERHETSVRFHFNLYTDADELMTKDHIIAKSNGGPNTMENYQVMCEECNILKDNT